MAVNGSNVINGLYGKVWWDGELLVEITSFTANLAINREEVRFNGQMIGDSKMTGMTPSGSMVLKKVYSRVARKIALALKDGKDVRSTLVAKTEDPDAKGTERVALYNVWFNEAILMAFEQGLGSETIPFGFSDFDYPDLIPEN